MPKVFSKNQKIHVIEYGSKQNGLEGLEEFFNFFRKMLHIK